MHDSLDEVDFFDLEDFHQTHFRRFTNPIVPQFSLHKTKTAFMPLGTKQYKIAAVLQFFPSGGTEMTD